MPSDTGERPRVPLSTYRLQLRPDFGFAAAAEQAGYLASLGVTHAYLSPVLQAAPGSTHGYDVVDHARVNAELGGEQGLVELVEAMHAAGLGVVVDVVPNHMAVPTPARLNAALWSVLREGPASPYARWFDVDWTAHRERDGHERAMLMPVLGRRIGDVVADGEITLDRSGDEPVLRYYEHEFPVRPGTDHLPLAELLDAQYYRLAWWRVGDEELNYRRFFDVDTLAGLRVEDPAVWAESSAVLLALVAEGRVDGLRIDHPDGLADPRGYLRRVAEATGGAWVVVEKILEGGERLPDDWPCAGTTGYDVLRLVAGVFRDPEGVRPLTDLWVSLTGAPPTARPVVEASKRWVVEHVLHAEVERLVDVAAAVCAGPLELRDHTRRGLHEALVELLVAMPVYRAYVVPGEPAPARSVELLDEAVAAARPHLDEDRWATLDLVRDLALGRLGSDPHRDELVVRFQQTCGPVMAKGVEDTAFYRWFRLAAANEVGGDLDEPVVAVADLHAALSRLADDWPASMTTLTTHDTKRSEDTRARLGVLTEMPSVWGGAVAEWRAATSAYRPEALDPTTEYLLWQTVVGTWPIDADRLGGYLQKALREAKVHTSWVSPDEDYEKAVQSFAEQVLADPEVRSGVEAVLDRMAEHVRVAVLGQKLVQLTAPGVPDVYQGCELEALALVDPDNRRPVDYADRARRLGELDAGRPPADLDDEKLLLTSRALRLRRERPGQLGPGAAYTPVPVTDDAAVAFLRGDEVLTVARRLPGRHRDLDAVSVELPDGAWRDVLTAAVHDGGRPVALAALLDRLPVALLARTPPVSR